MKDDAVIQRRLFRDIDLSDSFFDSLKEAYCEFETWFRKKAAQEALVVYDERGKLQGFMYLKQETGPIIDIEPPLNTPAALKVGTFKVEAHGTRLGERFVKKIFDYALGAGLSIIYVTVFSAHTKLIERLQAYGFVKHGSKIGPNGQEDVYIKDFARLRGDTRLDYPVIDALKSNKWLLAIRPDYHTKLFPDSILNTEDRKGVEDLTHTNSIHKVYIGWAPGLSDIRTGDTLVMYRMKDGDVPAEFSAVATSLCVVEEVRPRNTFRDEHDFVEYCKRHSVFDPNDLRTWFRNGAVHAIRMTYNVALPKRPNRRTLADEVGLDRQERWSVLRLSNEQFGRIIEKGQVHAGIVIHKA